MQYSDFDKDNMFEVLKNTYKQIEHASIITDETESFDFQNKINEIVILGMGGSAIGGDLLRSFLASNSETNRIRVNVVRGYDIPSYIDNNTLVIASSYSGNTEETLSALSQAMKQTNNILVLTSGGKIEQIAVEKNYNIVKMPKGYQPRCALSYSFYILLNIIVKSGLLSEDGNSLINDSISETLDIIKKRADDYSKKSDDNPAYEIAKKIKDKAPVIYSASERTDVVNLRWRGQFHENSKSLAFGNFLPEMNHNEINSWEMPDHLMNDFVIILLRDKNDHERVQIRFDALTQILGEKGLDIITVTGAGTSQLARIYDLVYLGDWVSYFLAEQYGKDPMAIPVILQLKEILSNK